MSVKVVDVAEKLRTKAGEAALKELAAKVRPRLQPDNDPPLRDRQIADGSADAFEKTVASFFSRNFIEGHHLEKEIGSAVIDALFAASGGDGVVNAQDVAKTLGPAGAKFFAQLVAMKTERRDDPLADRRLLDGVPDWERNLLVGAATSIAPPLPAVSQVARMVVKPNELKGMRLMGLQHLFASSASLFQELNKAGVQYGDMRFLGKIYSTNYRVAAELEAKGAVVDGASRRLVQHGKFADTMGESIEWQLKQMIETLPRPPEANPKPCCMIIDDGAEAILMLHKKWPEYAGYFACVEQTRRGSRIVHELADKGELKCAVANVAESWAKLEKESPMIGRSVVLEIGRKLDRLHASGADLGKDAVVIGYGAVGKEVAESLMARGYTVHIYDRDQSRLQDLPAGMVAHKDLGDALPFGELLVSCVGARTLQHTDHELLPDGAILVNAASADDELGPEALLPFSKGGQTIRDEQGRLWQPFRDKAVCVGLGEAEAHSDTVIRHPSGKEFLVVNNGYVVNMTGERDPIPPRFIQLTRGLLLLGAIAAKRAEGPGFIDVPKEWQEALVNLVERDLKKTGESLDQPAWDEREPPPPAEHIVPPASMDEMLVRDRQLKAFLGPLLPEPKQPVEKIYGYEIGPTAGRADARKLEKLIGNGDGTLTADEAAMHRASLTLNRHFGTSLRLSAQGNAEASTRETVTSSEFQDAGTIDTTAKIETTKQRFEMTYASLVVMVARNILDKRAGAPVDDAAVVKETAKMFATSSIDVTIFLDLLEGGADPKDRDFAAELRRAMAPPR